MTYKKGLKQENKACERGPGGALRLYYCVKARCFGASLTARQLRAPKVTCSRWDRIGHEVIPSLRWWYYVGSRQ